MGDRDDVALLSLAAFGCVTALGASAIGMTFRSMLAFDSYATTLVEWMIVFSRDSAVNLACYAVAWGTCGLALVTNVALGERGLVATSGVLSACAIVSLAVGLATAMYAEEWWWSDAPNPTVPVIGVISLLCLAGLVCLGPLAELRNQRAIAAIHVALTPRAVKSAPCHIAAWLIPAVALLILTTIPPVWILPEVLSESMMRGISMLLH